MEMMAVDPIQRVLAPRFGAVIAMPHWPRCFLLWASLVAGLWAWSRSGWTPALSGLKCRVVWKSGADVGNGFIKVWCLV